MLKLLSLLPLLPLLTTYLSSVTATCTRSFLLTSVNSYIAAQTTGNISLLNLPPTNFTYLENNKPSSFNSSSTAILTHPLKIDYNHSTVDAVACASYTLLISTTNGSGGKHPYVIATQIRYSSTQSGGKNGTRGVEGEGEEEQGEINVIDSIVATTGDLFFDAKKTLGYLQKEDWSEIGDVGMRSSREELKRVGDAYLDMWTDSKAADSILWGTDCERVEGSKYSKPCGSQLPHGGSAKRNGNRRYVIDEVMGSVDVLCSFDSLGDMPDSHEIRMEGGKVKYVHTVTVT